MWKQQASKGWKKVQNAQCQSSTGERPSKGLRRSKRRTLKKLQRAAKKARKSLKGMSKDDKRALLGLKGAKTKQLSSSGSSAASSLDLIAEIEKSFGGLI